MKSQWIAALCLTLMASITHAASSRPFELKASIDFSTTSEQYLLVYSSNEAGTGPNIYGRLLKLDGSPIGKDFRLSTQSGEMSKPVLAYSSARQRFLVVWGRKLSDEARSEIVGMTVGLDGKVVGEEFRMSFSDLYDQRPSVAYCPSHDRFFVTWERTADYDRDTGTSDVYGQFLEGDGVTFRGSNITVASGDKNQFKVDTTCDAVNDRFLAVWEDQRNLATQDDIYGRLIASDGTLLGDPFLIAGTPNLEGRPVVAANTKDGTYLAAWESLIDGNSRMFSQKLDANGGLVGGPLEIGAEVGGTRNRAAVAYLKQQDVFLVAFDNSAFANVSDGIYCQFVESSGALRGPAFAVTTAPLQQYRPGVAASRNTFLVVWTDYRDTANPAGPHNVYEYYGRVISVDMALSSRWRNPKSR